MPRLDMAVPVIIALLSLSRAGASDGAADDGRIPGVEKGLDIAQSILDRALLVGAKPEGFVWPPDPAAPGERGSVSGVVELGEMPLAGSRVCLLWVSKGVWITSRVPSVSTDALGRFEFPAVAFGEYRVIGETSEGWWESTEPLSVSPARKRADVSIRLGKNRLTVIVIGQDLHPIQGVRITATAVLEAMVGTHSHIETNSDGVATLRLFHDGDVAIYAAIGGTHSSVIVRPSELEGPVRMMMPPLGTIEVKLEGWDVRRHAGTVYVRSRSAERPTTIGTIVEASGTCRVRCVPGTWAVTFESHRGPKLILSTTTRVRAAEAIGVALQIR